MTSDEYRTAYAALGLTQAGVARLLGVDERTSRRWAAGEREVPPPVGRFLSFLVLSDITAEEVMQTLTPKS